MIWAGARLVTEMGGRYPDLIPLFNRAIQASPRVMVERGRSYEMLTVEGNDLPNHRELEMGIPAEKAEEALRALKALAEHHRVNMTDGIRYTKGDDFFMSPAYGRDTAYVAAYTGYTEDADRFLKEAEQMLHDVYGGRPHLGKETFLSPEQIREAFPDWERYDAIRRELDPNNTFENAFIKRLFIDR
jgi:L-gulonolactone oxidase